MLQFKITDTAANIIVTLSELATLGEPNYLFVFTQVTTKAVVSFVVTPADDLSTHKERYNEYEINPSVLFLNKDVGEWHYTVYEQDSTTNTDVSLTGGIIEKGKLRLLRDAEFEFEMYNNSVTFKTYNG